MLTEERYAKILSILESMGSATVRQLMTELNASESTVRRDLTELDGQKQLTKVRGGAMVRNTIYGTTDDAVMSRKGQHAQAKERIARYAAGLIEPDDFIYLDAGTTTERVIDYLSSKQTVFVTNAVMHAKRLSEKGYKVYLIGGEYKGVTGAIVGEEAVNSVEKYNFTKGFWGSNGISIQRGFSTPEVKEALVKKRSMENCKKRYVLADESKFNQISSVTFAPFDSATVITTGNLPLVFQKRGNILLI